MPNIILIGIDYIDVKYPEDLFPLFHLKNLTPFIKNILCFDSEETKTVYQKKKSKRQKKW